MPDTKLISAQKTPDWRRRSDAPRTRSCDSAGMVAYGSQRPCAARPQAPALPGTSAVFLAAAVVFRFFFVEEMGQSCLYGKEAPGAGCSRPVGVRD